MGGAGDSLAPFGDPADRNVRGHRRETGVRTGCGHPPNSDRRVAGRNWEDGRATQNRIFRKLLPIVQTIFEVILDGGNSDVFTVFDVELNEQGGGF